MIPWGEKTSPSLSWMGSKIRGGSVKCSCADLEIGRLGCVSTWSYNLSRAFSCRWDWFPAIASYSIVFLFLLATKCPCGPHIPAGAERRSFLDDDGRSAEQDDGRVCYINTTRVRVPLWHFLWHHHLSKEGENESYSVVTDTKVSHQGDRSGGKIYWAVGADDGRGERVSAWRSRWKSFWGTQQTIFGRLCSSHCPVPLLTFVVQIWGRNTAVFVTRFHSVHLSQSGLKIRSVELRWVRIWLRSQTEGLAEVPGLETHFCLSHIMLKLSPIKLEIFYKNPEIFWFSWNTEMYIYTGPPFPRGSVVSSSLRLLDKCGWFTSPQPAPSICLNDLFAAGSISLRHTCSRSFC